MSDNYDSGFDLVLSDYERRDLIAHYETDSLPDYLSCNDDDMWYGYQIGDRMFDLNVWHDEDTDNTVCTVYECDWINDNWTTSLRHSWTLTGGEHE
jgi:hypothetical protein